MPVRSFDRITIPAPCNADWDSMIGNDQVRFCEHCNLHVTDLSALTRSQAMRLVARSQGRLCVRFIQRPDGGVLTKAPEKLYRIGRRASRIAAGAFTAALSVSSVAAQTLSESNIGGTRERVSISRMTSPTETGTGLSGLITDPNGALIRGAILTLISPQTGQAFSYTTAEDGAYRFSFLEEGRYSLVIEASSFTRREVPELEVRRDTNRTLDIAMEIPPIIAEVEVRSETEIQVQVQGGAMFSAPEEPLVKAAFDDDLELVKQLAFSALDVNVRDKQTHLTALDHAVENGNVEIVHTLLLAGAWVNTKDEWGRTALMLLRENATDELVRELLSAGAKVNARNESGGSALMNAASFSNYAAVKELLENGAKVDLKDQDGKTALMCAADNSDPRIAKLLIDAGAAVNAKDEDGKTALMIAADEGDPETVKLLISFNADVNARDDNGACALMFAASTRDVESVEALLNAGADVTFKDNDGKTALARARENAKDEIAKLLESRGAPE